MNLILIRHAESHHAQQNIIADIRGCTGLTQHGLEQAQLLANRFRMTEELDNCRTMLCSPVLRASQTAKIIADTIKFDFLLQDNNLCELNPGIADGVSIQEYRNKFGEFDMISFPHRLFAPEGESWFMFISRVQNTLERLAYQYNDQTIVAVTHAGFIVATFMVLFNVPRPGTGSYINPAHTSLTEWSKTNNTWQLKKYNDALHLKVSIWKLK